MESRAREVFAKAGVDPEKNAATFLEVCMILMTKMATLSATSSDAYEEQKRVLIEDLIVLKERGELAL